MPAGASPLAFIPACVPQKLERNPARKRGNRKNPQEKKNRRSQEKKNRRSQEKINRRSQEKKNRRSQEKINRRSQEKKTEERRKG
jgi:hypothetical protein